MGLFDVVVFEMECRGFRDGVFKPRALIDCCMDRFVVTRGRLCLTGNEFMVDVEKPEAERVDIDYHGDIRLLAEDGQVSEDGHDEYTARFTHGALEWIRPADTGSAVDLAFKKSRCRAPSD